MSASNPVDQIAFFEAAANRYEAISADCTQDLARAVVALPQVSQLFLEDSLVLDNAAGTGFVTGEIIRHARETNRPIPRVCVVDPAPTMISLAKRKLADLGVGHLCSTHIMPGEKLEFTDCHFTQSITNLGIMFFKDSAAGLREIYRTLKPGGVAVVTCWANLAFMNIIRESQLIARPTDKPFEVTYDRQWLKPSYLENMMKREGGFASVTMETYEAHFGLPTFEELEEMMVHRFIPSSKEWPADERAAFQRAVKERLREVARPYTMLDGKPGVGFPLTAVIAIGTKG